MEIKKGVAVSPGISIAKSLVLDAEDYLIPKRLIKPSQRMTEIQRARNAFKDAAEELEKLEQQQNSFEQHKIKDIFAVHLSGLIAVTGCCFQNGGCAAFPGWRIWNKYRIGYNGALVFIISLCQFQ